MNMFIQISLQLFFIFIINFPVFGVLSKPDSVSQKVRENCDNWRCQNSPEQVQNISIYNDIDKKLKVVTFSSRTAFLQVVYLDNMVLDFSGLETDGYFISYQHNYHGITVSTVIENGIQTSQEISYNDLNSRKIFDSLLLMQNIHFGTDYIYENVDDNMHDPCDYSAGSCVKYDPIGIAIRLEDVLAGHRDGYWIESYFFPDRIIESKKLGKHGLFIEETESINGLLFTKYEMRTMTIYTFPHSATGQIYPTAEIVILKKIA